MIDAHAHHADLIPYPSIRWERRAAARPDLGDYFSQVTTVLQQRFYRPGGEEVWLDVPTVDEGEVMTDDTSAVRPTCAICGYSINESVVYWLNGVPYHGRCLPAPCGPIDDDPGLTLTPDDLRQVREALEHAQAWLAGAGPSEIGRALGRKHNSIIGRQMTLARRDARAEARAATNHNPQQAPALMRADRSI